MPTPAAGTPAYLRLMLQRAEIIPTRPTPLPAVDWSQVPEWAEHVTVELVDGVYIASARLI